MNKIELRKISKSFGNNSVLKDIDYTFYTGNLYILKGKSGSGKSTLISLIGQLDNPTSGEVLYDDKSVKDINNYVENNISYIFQDNNVFLDLTVLDNLSLVTSDVELIKSTLKDFGILDKLNNKASSLSKGEKNRLVLARIILEDKPILLIDEPIGNLDEENAKYSLGVLNKIANNHLVIMIMHNDIELEEYDPIVLTMNNKQIVTEGTVIENVEIETKKNSRSVSLKHMIIFVKTIFKNNPFRVVFGTLIQIVFFFVTFLIISFISTDLNQQVISKINEKNIDMISVISNTPKDYLYRDYIFTISDGNNKYKIECLYSQTDVFELEGKQFELSDNKLVLSQSFLDENEFFEINENIEIAGVTLDVSLGTSKFSLLSNNVVAELARIHEYRLIKDDLERFMVYHTGIYLFDNLTLYNSNTINKDFDYTYASELVGNQINIILPYSEYYDYDSIYQNILNNELLSIHHEMFSLDDIAPSFIVKGIIIDPIYLGSGIQLSNSLFQSFADKYYEKGYLSSISRNSYMLSEKNFDRYNFVNNINLFSDILELSIDDVNVIQTVNTMKKIMVCILPLIIVLNLVSFYFTTNGYATSFEKQKNLLYSLGYKRKDISLINVIFNSFLIVASIAISLIAFALSAPHLRNLFFTMLKYNTKFSIFNNYIFVIIYLIIFILVSLLFVALFRTKKNMSKMLEIMKKNLE